MMTASPSPASSAARRITSLSNALSRQPNVTMSRPGIASPAEQRGVEAALERERHRPGHDHMTILAPGDLKLATIENNRRVPPHQAAALGGDQRGAGAAAA